MLLATLERPQKKTSGNPNMMDSVMSIWSLMERSSHRDGPSYNCGNPFTGDPVTPYLEKQSYISLSSRKPIFGRLKCRYER